MIVDAEANSRKLAAARINSLARVLRLAFGWCNMLANFILVPCPVKRRAILSTNLTQPHAAYRPVPTRNPTQYRQYHTIVRQYRRRATPGRATGLPAGRQPPEAGGAGLFEHGRCAPVLELAGFYAATARNAAVGIQHTSVKTI